MKYIDHLKLIIAYLDGTGDDLYSGIHNDTLRVWNGLADELNYLGYRNDATGIKKYIREQL